VLAIFSLLDVASAERLEVKRVLTGIGYREQEL